MEKYRAFLPGKRIIKTAIAVGICLLISKWMSFPSNFYMVIAAVLAMKSSPQQSLEYGKNRLKGTLMGGLFGIVVLYIFEYYKIEINSMSYITINVIATIFCFWVCKLLNFNDIGGSMSCVVLFTITIPRVNQDIVTYVIVRVIETLIGIIIATIVNKYLFVNHHLDEENIDNGIEEKKK